jgi:putative membrane protein
MTALLLAWHDGYRHGGGFWFPLIPVLFLGLWVTLFVTIGWRWRHGYGHGSGPSPESVLGERYARGEIDEAEYRQRRSVLRAKD